MGEGHELNDGDTYVCFRDGAFFHSVRGVGSLEREQLSLAVVVMMGFKGIHASSSAVHELFKVMLRSVRW